METPNDIITEYPPAIPAVSVPASNMEGLVHELKYYTWDKIKETTSSIYS